MLALLLWGCTSPWAHAEEAFPYVYTAEADLPDYALVRWETETWDPDTDFAEVGLYLLKAANHKPSAPVEEIAHFDAMRPQLPPLQSGLQLSFAGDIMWVGDGWSDVMVDVAPLFADADLRLGNLETPTSPDDPTDPEDLPLYAFNAPVELLDSLPFDALQLNNNHSLDVGDSGLTATLGEVAGHGYVAHGIDQHAIVEVDGTQIALLAYTWGVNRPEIPTTHELFVVPFGHLDEPIDLSGIGADIADARASGADRVVVLPHWGFEYEYYADPHFLILGRQIVALGADLIVGTGPHVVQPPEICHVNDRRYRPGVGTCSLETDDGEPRTAAILYSLGNAATLMPTLQCQVGIAATVSFDDDGVSGLGWAPLVSMDTDAGIHVIPLADTLTEPDYAAESDRLDAHLGTAWKR